MTDAEREALVERMLDAFSDNEWRTSSSAMRAALSVAEQVVRDDCIAAARDALNSYGRWDGAITPDTLMAKIEPAIRARGAA